MPSVEEIGALLRTTRQQSDIDLSAVHDRLGRPVLELDALERGDLSSLPDQALALSTVRRYANLLGLDGDRVALDLLDAWTEGATPATAVQGAISATTGATLAVPVVEEAMTRTGEVPVIADGAGYIAPSDGPTTGTFPVVPRTEIRNSKRQAARNRRRTEAPQWLKVTTWVAGIALVAVCILAALDVWRPVSLANAHILRVIQPGTTVPSTTPQPSTTATTSPLQHSPVVLANMTATSATYTVSTQKFSVDLATTAPCWVQVTDSTQATPLLVGVQQAGQSFHFPARGTLTVEVGSSGVAVGVTIAGKQVFATSPKAAPFSYVFAPAGAPSL